MVSEEIRRRSSEGSLRKALQAAGHEGARQGEGLFIKPSTQAEIDFYQWIVNRPSALSSFVPLFMGTLCEPVPLVTSPSIHDEAFDADESAVASDNSLEGEIRAGLRPMIVLEDLCEGFERPSVMDIKLGSQLWDDGASPEKRARLDEVSRTTTSGSLGFRIAGNTFINENGEREYRGKDFGRSATAENIDQYLLEFWPQLSNDYIYSALVSIIAQLEQLYQALIDEPLELHSASVLILHEGDLQAMERKVAATKEINAGGDFSTEIDNDSYERKESNDARDRENNHDDSEDDDDSGDLKVDKNKLVDLRLVDFAHTVQASEPSPDVMRGLRELIKALRRISQSV